MDELDKDSDEDLNQEIKIIKTRLDLVAKELMILRYALVILWLSFIFLVLFLFGII